MGCIDCHGSYDLHGGDVTDPASASLVSRMEQAVAIRCESCHGGPSDLRDDGRRDAARRHAAVSSAVDAEGNVLDHVYVGDDGNYWMRSKPDRRDALRLADARHDRRLRRAEPGLRPAGLHAQGLLRHGPRGRQPGDGHRSAADGRRAARLHAHREHELRRVPRLVDEHLHGVSPRGRVPREQQPVQQHHRREHRLQRGRGAVRLPVADPVPARRQRARQDHADQLEHQDVLPVEGPLRQPLGRTSRSRTATRTATTRRRRSRRSATTR